MVKPALSTIPVRPHGPAPHATTTPGLVPGPAPAPEPRSAYDELSRLVHGPCDRALLRTLHDALAEGPIAARATGLALPDRRDRSTRIAGRLARLARALPPGRRLLQDPAAMAALHAWTAVADPALCMTVVNHYVLCLGSMARLAPEHDALEIPFAALESARAKGAYLITEVGRANSHLDTRTTATFDPATREFVLHTPDPSAAKFSGVGAIGHPQIAVVPARLIVGRADRGVFSFAVDLTDHEGPRPGVEISTVFEMSALPLDYAQVRFHKVRLPYERWLRDDASIGADGVFRDPLGSADLRLARKLCVGQDLWGALPSAAAAIARQSAVLGLRYARGRRTQGRLAPGTPLLEYLTAQHALIGALADAFALTCAANRAQAIWAETVAPSAGGFSDGHPGAEDSASTTSEMTFGPWAAVSRPLSAYKAHTVRTAARITADCQQQCGFSGHLDVNRLPAYLGFLRAFDTAGGDSQLIFYDLGRARIEEPDAGQPAFSSARRGADTYPRWWPAVIRAHEQRLAQRLRLRRDEAVIGTGTTDEFLLWNPLLGAAGELGEAYAARLAAEDLAATLDTVRDPGLKSVLGLLASLHGVLAARRWAGSLLTAGTLHPRDVQGLSHTADLLCEELTPHLPMLEDAFAYPLDLVGSPLGAADYNQALADRLGRREGGSR